jgi:DNA-binding Lrp family transcriptional regulator
MIRALQKNLPLVARPFEHLAREAEVKSADLLVAARSYLERGIMRRFAAVLRHRQAGFGANAMGVWAIAEGEEDEFGAAAATFDAVSHCYRRPAYPDWPYNVFTMVHGKSREDCEAVLAEIARVTDVHNRAALYSTHEYKKVRLKYFTPDTLEWEAAANAPPNSENLAPAHAVPEHQ